MSIQCSSKTQAPDRNRCFNHWPQYPCYDARMRACYSPEGIQLFDPFSDVLYGVSSTYLAVLNFAERLITGTPARRRAIVERRVRETINDWGPSMLGGPRPLLMSGDAPLQTNIPLIQLSEQVPGRYYTAQDIENTVLAIPEHLRTARELIVGPSKQQQQRPPGIRRAASDEVNAGRVVGRRTRRSGKSICGFCETMCKRKGRKKRRNERTRRKKY